MSEPTFIQLGTGTEYIYNIAHVSCIWPETIVVSEAALLFNAHKNLPFDGDKAYCVCIRETNGKERNCVYKTPEIRDAAFAAISAALKPLVVVGPPDPSRNT